MSVFSAEIWERAILNNSSFKDLFEPIQLKRGKNVEKISLTDFYVRTIRKKDIFTKDVCDKDDYGKNEVLFYALVKRWRFMHKKEITPVIVGYMFDDSREKIIMRCAMRGISVC